MEKPDWLRWHAHKVATLPECVCLSLDAEPHPIGVPAPPTLPLKASPKNAKARHNDQVEPPAAPIVVATFRNESTADRAERMLGSHPALQTLEAAERYARLRAHFLDRHPLLPGAGMSFMGVREEVVTVYDFARWANAAGWALPPVLLLGCNTCSKDPIGQVPGETINRSTSITGTVAPLPRFAAQEASVLAAIESAGYDPRRLPRAGAGRPGVKSEIRCALKGTSLFVDGSTVFDKAWERLLARGDLAYE